ncbi:hypothetical protein PSHT_10592 [Puccinia striiformis]|uniref:Uncharacterized protein n=1 Tax=Puccinia striiformis TaxID=27350 RepID=A0A2S4V8T3_9BASI|nr:hypothetical protein PSHT_10592 [Puccinia striiformis]
MMSASLQTESACEQSGGQLHHGASFELWYVSIGCFRAKASDGYVPKHPMDVLGPDDPLDAFEKHSLDHPDQRHPSDTPPTIHRMVSKPSDGCFFDLPPKAPQHPSKSDNTSLKMAKSTHTSAAPRKQTTKGPLPTRAKITHNQQKEESSSLSEVESSESDVEFSDMSTSQPKKMDNNKNKLDKTPKKTEIPIKSTNNVPENPKKSTKKIPENTNKSTKKIPEESSKKVSLKSAKKSEKKNEEIVKPVKKLDKKLEPVKIAKKSLVIPRSPPENPPEHSSEPIFHIQPPPQEIFQDQQECTQSIQQFALNRGYLIKIRNSCPTNTFYRCSRGGSASQNEHKDRKSKNPATSQLIGCPFEN